MFDNYEQKDQRKAKADFKTCKAVFDAMRTAGKTDEETKKVLLAMLDGKAWQDEIIQELFHPYESYRQRERKQRSYREERQRQYQRNYDNWYRQQSSNSYGQHSLTEALQFFGFTAMPNPDELKRKYRELALKNHPDKGGDTATFQRLQSYKDQLYARAGL